MLLSGFPLHRGSESSSEAKSVAESPITQALSSGGDRQPKVSSCSPSGNGESRTVEGLFGDSAELSTSLVNLSCTCVLMFE